MASTTTAPRFTVADTLLQDGLISRDQYESAVSEYERTKRSLIRILSDMGALSEEARLSFLQRTYNCDVMRLKDVQPEPEVSGFLTRDMCRRHHLAPIHIDKSGSVVVAMEDPSDVRMIADMEKIFGRNVRVALADSRDITETIDRMAESRDAIAVNNAIPSTAHKAIESVSLIILAMGPMAASFYFVFYTKAGQDWYAKFSFESIETAIVLMVAWGSWAAIAYFINDLIFNKQSQ
ncbi:hypothetical protein BH09SUM1_BH09SUM1_04270 [soil metagenome]